MSGLYAQLGGGEESTYGTAATISRFWPFTSEGLRQDIARMESKGLRAGTRVLRSDQWAAGQKTVAGPLELEILDRSMGLLLKHAFGGLATSTPTNGILTRDHVFTPGDLPVGLTLQVGKPDESNTVHPFNYLGSRVASWSLAASVGEIGKLGLDIVAQDENTAAPVLATASYPTASLLTFVGATLDIAGSAVDVESFEVNGDNGLAADRHKLGQQTIKQPVEVDMRRYAGNVAAWFEDLVAYNRFVNGTEGALVAKFVGAEIEQVTPTYNYELEVTCNVRYDGDTPEVGGPDEVKQSLPFVCLDDGSGPDSAISVLYRTTDTTP